MPTFLSPSDPDATEVYLEKLAACGRPQTAADASGQRMLSMEGRRRYDPEFAERYQEARRRYAEILEAEMHRRAVLGVGTPIFNKDGEQVGTKVEYSDRLLELAIKKANPEFREKMQVDVAHSGGVLVVGVTPRTAEAWKKQVEEAESAKVVEGPLTTPLQIASPPGDGACGIHPRMPDPTPAADGDDEGEQAA